MSRLTEDWERIRPDNQYTNIEAITFWQKNSQMPVVNPDRLEARIKEKRQQGEPVKLVTFACMPKFKPYGYNKSVADVDPSSRTAFEIKAKELRKYVETIERQLELPIQNDIILGDTDSRLIAAYSRMAYASPQTNDFLSALEREELEMAMQQRLSRKLVSGQNIFRTSQLIPRVFYKEYWRPFFNYFLELNATEEFKQRLWGKIEMFQIQRMPYTEWLRKKALRTLAASDAQYAIEGAYLASRGDIDAICIIDPLPLFQAQKHEVGAKGQMSYIFPLAENEQR